MPWTATRHVFPAKPNPAARRVFQLKNFGPKMDYPFRTSSSLIFEGRVRGSENSRFWVLCEERKKKKCAIFELAGVFAPFPSPSPVPFTHTVTHTH